MNYLNMEIVPEEITADLASTHPTSLVFQSPSAPAPAPTSSVPSQREYLERAKRAVDRMEQIRATIDELEMEQNACVHEAKSCMTRARVQKWMIANKCNEPYLYSLDEGWIRNVWRRIVSACGGDEACAKLMFSPPGKTSWMMNDCVVALSGREDEDTAARIVAFAQGRRDVWTVKLFHIKRRINLKAMFASESEAEACVQKLVGMGMSEEFIEGPTRDVAQAQAGRETLVQRMHTHGSEQYLINGAKAILGITE
jgi:hypothetical protein